uniref:Uncharacterized protein n=1 Tax=Rhizophora mucronata TaxID=61149 RepID=A0A2P2QP11_RHIMU
MGHLQKLCVLAGYFTQLNCLTKIQLKLVNIHFCPPIHSFDFSQRQNGS